MRSGLLCLRVQGSTKGVNAAAAQRAPVPTRTTCNGELEPAVDTGGCEIGELPVFCRAAAGCPYGREALYPRRAAV